MTAEHIHDALNYLSDDLLQATDALRQKKRIPWKSFAALAACACLVAGLWLFFPGVTAMDSATENALPETEDLQASSTTGEYICALVVAVQTDKILVTTAQSETVLTVYPDALAEIPSLKAGQKIRIYCGNADSGAGQTESGLHPYRIEIVEN